MADLHKAIRAIHDTTVSIDGGTKADITALDSSGNEISINWSDVEAWTDPNGYKLDRAIAYPNVDVFMEAYTEKEIGGSSTKWNAYVTAYNKVRSDNAKPE
tara:strand:- start:335 stop:637 length:303 start_codon:yes stop_codon:yes gene_type:complete